MDTIYEVMEQGKIVKEDSSSTLMDEGIQQKKEIRRRRSISRESTPNSMDIKGNLITF